MVPPIKLDIDKDTLLFKNEAPRHLIGYSQQVFNGALTYHAERVGITPGYTDIRREVKLLIKRLRRKSKASILNNTDFEAITSALENKDDEAYYQPLINNIPREGRPIFEVNSPTLFVFSTNYTNVTFRDECVRWDEDTGTDPHCSGLRLWNDGTVLGMYSKYDHGLPGMQEGLHYYDLVVGTEVVFGEGENPTTQPVNSLFDPGNGNGGGDRFP